MNTCTDITTLNSRDIRTGCDERTDIVLIGMPYVGKSTVGVLLAHETKRPLLDTDSQIERDTMRTADEIIRDSGIDFFRRLETGLLHRICDTEHGRVIACGGGFVCLHDFYNIKQHSVIVYLSATVKTLCNRRDESKQIRPLIGNNVGHSLTQMFTNRQDLYSRYADITVCTDGKDAPQVVQDILLSLNI